MAITLPSGFRITNNEPGDSRVAVTNQAARLAFSAANVYKGLLVFQQDTQELYVLINESSPTDNNSWAKVFTGTGTSGSYTGSFSGNGSGLTNVPASGIVGLNLSQVATGSVSASVNVGSTSLQVASGSSTLFTVSNVGAVVVSSSINIGNAEDGDYTDGLYTDLTPATTVGTVVDRFNEVLKGLSPSPAPDLSNVESSTTSGINNLSLAFGSTLSTSSYSNVIGTGSLSAVDFTGVYSVSTGAGGGRTRLGVFASTTTITAVLNENVSANGSPFTNYPANALNVPAAGGESYTLEVNGNNYVETTSGTGSLSGTYFTLSSAATGFFPATGLPFAIFRNRTGTVIIPAGLWRNGWNYVRIKQGTNVTNFIDWIYDPAAANGNFNYSMTGFTTSSVSPTGQKNLSGIKYYTGFSYIVTGSISNYYKNTYDTNSKSFSSLSSGLSAGSISIPTPTSANSTITASSTHTFASSGYRILGSTLTSTLSISNNFSKSTSTTVTTPTILLDNLNTANTTIAENFCLEDYRLPSASYDTQASVTSAAGTFPSVSALGTPDLAVYAGTLRYPTQVLNSGNVSGAGVVYAIAGQPNYSAASGTRYFYRVFTNGASQVAGWSITVNGTSTSFVSFGTALTGNNMRIGIKVPGATGYRDMLTAAPGAGSYSPLADGVGCQSGGAISLGVAGALSLVSERLPAGQVFVLRLEVGSSWSGNISSISITGL